MACILNLDPHYNWQNYTLQLLCWNFDSKIMKQIEAYRYQQLGINGEANVWQQQTSMM